MIWIQIILTVIGFLLEWLLTQQSQGKQLTSEEADKLNSILNTFHKIEPVAVALGCSPQGIPPSNPDKQE